MAGSEGKASNGGVARLGRGDASTASALATAERVNPQSMGITLAQLEQMGLITRTPDRSDGRRQIVELTAAGREHVVGARQARKKWLAASLEGEFTENEQQLIIAAMALLDRGRTSRPTAIRSPAHQVPAAALRPWLPGRTS